MLGGRRICEEAWVIEGSLHYLLTSTRFTIGFFISYSRHS
jgi:hypothetical protein